MTTSPQTIWPDTCAVILAGGFGTRLQSVINDRPKCLAPILGKPFLAHQLERLSAAGIRRTVICTGYLADQVENAIGPEFAGMQILYSQEHQPLGTAGAIRLACDKIKAKSLLVLNGDSVCAANLSLFASDYTKCAKSPLMLLTLVEDTYRFGRVECDDSVNPPKVRHFMEKGVAGQGWINAGIYLLPRSKVMEIPEGRACSIEKEIFPAWSAAGKLFACKIDSEFLDIGTPESYTLANVFFARMQASNSQN